MIMKGSKTFKGPSFLHHKTSLGRIQESITKESKTFMTCTEPSRNTTGGFRKNLRVRVRRRPVQSREGSISFVRWNLEILSQSPKDL
jgi:hypothetical protein